MNKTGLVLEGGAMRGLFTAGVLDVFLENNIGFDGCIGVSAGAAFGCTYHSGQKGRTIRYNKRFAKDPRYCSLRSWIKTGDLYGVVFCYRELPEELDKFDNDAFIKNPAVYEAMARRHEEYNRMMELMEVLEEKGEILVIRPPEKLPVGHIEHDPDKMQTTYDIGRAEAQKYIKKVKEFIKKEG